MLITSGCSRSLRSLGQKYVGCLRCAHHYSLRFFAPKPGVIQLGIAVKKLFWLISLVCLLITFPSSSEQQIDIDDLLVEAFKLATEKSFEQSYKSYLSIIELDEALNDRQKVNAYYGALELAFILKEEEVAAEYGETLINLLSQNKKYEEVYIRLISRICSSDDWAFYRHNFADICVN